MQRCCLQTSAKWAGLDENEIGQAVDGCGVVAFSLPLDGMARAEGKHGIKSKIIICCLRHLGEEAGLRMLSDAGPCLDKVVGLGLDSSERDFPGDAAFCRIAVRRSGR